MDSVRELLQQRDGFSNGDEYGDGGYGYGDADGYGYGSNGSGLGDSYGLGNGFGDGGNHTAWAP